MKDIGFWDLLQHDLYIETTRAHYKYLKVGLRVYVCMFVCGYVSIYIYTYWNYMHRKYKGRPDIITPNPILHGALVL